MVSHIKPSPFLHHALLYAILRIPAVKLILGVSAVTEALTAVVHATVFASRSKVAAGGATVVL